jgi:cytochrome c oxidase cbb3-type subunit 1
LQDHQWNFRNDHEIFVMQEYDLKVVRYFVWAALLWGLVGMAVGVLLALQLYWPGANFEIPYLTFGRIRPVHTNAVIYGFSCCLLFGGSLYIVQKTGKCNLFNQSLGWMVFWGWQLVIVLAAITLPLGFTSSKEFAELEWPIDILVVVVWVLYAIEFFGTLAKRKDPHIFVSNWFFGAFIIVVALIYVVNNLALPVSAFKSYSIYSGVEDALVQWWWGHNAVGFLLTAGVIGLGYYFIPKVAERPIYSYRLSIISFWGLVGFYTWAGTHHLIYSSVPEWAQSLGIVMSLLLFIPSWAGAFNLYMTARSNPEKMRTDLNLRFFKWAVIYYALSTFEGPLLAIPWFNMLGHNTDWIIGHVHSGTLGWVGFSLIGVLYYFVPQLLGGDSRLWSRKLILWHYWLAHAGIVLYIVSMWVSGIGAGVMWLATEPDGTMTYTFIDSLRFSHPWQLVRFVGGALYLAGFVLMLINIRKTRLARDKELMIERILANA